MPCCEKLLQAAQQVTPCECEPSSFPFVCPRHPACAKNEHFYRLCKTNLEYHRGWDTGRSPCLPIDGLAVPVGLGDVVAFAVRMATVGLVKMCDGCRGRKARLNRIRLWPLPRPSWKGPGKRR